jgi:orotidine-5'-phosphate decarboxylase
MSRQSYASRAENFGNLAAKSLLECMERKRSNLCVSVDVTKKASVLRVAEAVAPFACLIKVWMHRL